MPPLYSVADILSATGGRPEQLRADTFTSVSIDSREIEPGALFVAIEGDRFDGHDFVHAAIEAGAGAALVSENRAVALAGHSLIVVPDALEGLVDLARFARHRSKARFVAVTGSAGKTTMKEMIRTLLSGQGQTHASIRSFNNHWGVPLMLARMPAEAEFGVFEIGMNHAGEITPLTKLVRPHIAVVTGIGPAHLEHFGSVEGIARAKAEIFAGLEPGGSAIINADHDHLDVLLAEAKRLGVRHVTTYGYRPGSDVPILAAGPADDGYAGRFGLGDDEVPFRLRSAGKHMIANGVGALCVANSLGVDIHAAIDALGELGAPEGRGAVSMLGPSERPLILIDESYNANPSSMRAALEVFMARQAKTGRKVLVLGDMRELGAAAPKLHAELAPVVEAAGADLVYLVGNEMRALAEALGDKPVTIHVQTVEEVVDPVLNSLAYGDTIMVKGSNGVRLSGLVSHIRGQFSGRRMAGESGGDAL